ncbi:MAG: FAD-binding protein [Candidatus Pacebacteria bacterium]|nr:FAD-binding protein [Candidatus Paceibacterota bacterium]
MKKFAPTTEAELSEVIASATAPFELTAGGSKLGFGHRIACDQRLDLTGFNQVRLYEPHELIVAAGAATPLTSLNQLLAAKSQILTFEPPDWRWLLNGGSKAEWRSRPDPATIGGVIATNLSGSARLKAGAARDSLLGFHGVNGLGEVIHGGGRVVKNVTGYDLPKLIAGSFGTLVAMTDVTLKAMPAPEDETTLVIFGLTAAEGIAAAARALNSPHEIHCAAYLPPAAANLAGLTDGAVLLRLVGSTPSIKPRSDAVIALLAVKGEVIRMAAAASQVLWQRVGNGELLPELEPTSRMQQVIWRLSVAPQSAAGLMEKLVREFAEYELRLDHYFDWAGGMVLLSLIGSPQSLALVEDAVVIRRAIQDHGGGHATLLRSPKNQPEIFEPLAPSLAALTARVKASFDPHSLLNPGKIYGRITA